MTSTKVAILISIVAAMLGASGCKKDGAKTDGPGAASAATTGASGCGADYADPQKEFCVKIPAGYTASAPKKPDELYSERISFDGDMSGFDISVGFTSSNWKTFEDQMKADESWVGGKDMTIVSSGKTPGTGKWWVFKRKGETDAEVQTTVKSNGGKAIRCAANNTVVKPEVIEACKSVRAYPK